jgi:N6-adenosine-specific RNA methylase IME4
MFEMDDDTASPSSILFASSDKKIVLLDVLRTIEEAQEPSAHATPGGRQQGKSPSHHHNQHHHGRRRCRRLYSAQEPLSAPFATPDPKRGEGAFGIQIKSPAAQIADLMAAATTQNALSALHQAYAGPFHLPRLLQPSLNDEQSDEHGDNPSAKPIDPSWSTCFIPQGAQYLQGPIEELAPAFRQRAPPAVFDLIVLDPPWPNRSARRKKAGHRYATASSLDEMRALLSHVPVASHLSPRGVVALWITNSTSVLDFVNHPSGGLLASWGLDLVAEWTWIKVTSTGEPIVDVDSTWRKPWERLLIARRIGAPPLPALVPDLAIVAVPDVHSRKPNLRGLFEESLGRGFVGLEVFARNLTAGWWCWGDEVLLFQGNSHWHIDD